MNDNERPRHMAPAGEQGNDPLLGPPVPFDPHDFGLTPELLEDHKALVDESLNDQTLFSLLWAKLQLERLQGTPAEPTDYAEMHGSFQDRIQLRKSILGG